MNETNFTPGPWVARIEDHSFCDTGDVFTSFTVATEGAGKYDCFAEVFTRNDDIDEAIANTKLIAAAPELYKELEKHCALCMMMHPDCEGCEICDTGKVLKKARGEEE